MLLSGEWIGLNGPARPEEALKGNEGNKGKISMLWGISPNFGEQGEIEFGFGENILKKGKKVEKGEKGEIEYIRFPNLAVY